MKLQLDAPAKINLTLEVLGKRSDGYHDIRSVIQAISLSDTLTFAPAREIGFTCNIPELASDDNLVVRAARLFKATLGYEAGAAIHLEKRIPHAAGLGGGSSDAATTLRGLSQLWGVKEHPVDRLMEIGRQLGMDIPFFLHGGTALLQARGDLVVPLPSLKPTYFVLLHPAIHLTAKTARMFGSVSPASYTTGKATQRLVDALRQSRPLADSLLFNVFESVAGRVFPGLGDLWRKFEEIGERPVHLAGSGPTLFCLAVDRTDAERIRDALISSGLEAHSCETVPRQRESRESRVEGPGVGS